MTRSLSLSLSLSRDDATPLYVQIFDQLSASILTGRLKPGERLMSTRAMAQALGVHRNTVIRAYDELQAQGLVEQRVGSGAYVRRGLVMGTPAALSGALRAAQVLGFELDERTPPPRLRDALERPAGALRMGGGEPDVRLMPGGLLARAYRRVLARRGSEVLAYGEPRGHLALREQLCSVLRAQRLVDASPDELLLTQGSQQGLALLSDVLIGPGDRVVVEALSYQPALEVFLRAGASLVTLPVDAQGAQVFELDAIHAQAPIRAIYLTPHHQYPTTVTLDASRRIYLLNWAAKHKVAIIEDDYDHEFHYEGQPVHPLLSLDASGVVCYVGTLSKTLAPGLRKGYVIAPAQVIERMAMQRLLRDRQGDRVTEAALAELMEDGTLGRHTRKMQHIYMQRRDALARSLERHLSDLVSFELPRGGMTIWVKVLDEQLDVGAWAHRALALGVAVSDGGWFRATADVPDPRALRIGFASCHLQELELGVTRLKAALSMQD